MSKPQSIRDVSTPVLKAMRGMCPKKSGDFTGVQISITRYGQAPADDGPTLTYETRKRINAELKRRRGR